MKKIIIPILCLFVIKGQAQLTGGTLLPTGKYQGFNKSAIATGKKVLDGKYSYYDTINFVSRPFISVAEANTFLPANQRGLGQTVLINSGGAVNSGSAVTLSGVTYATGEIIGGSNTEYWYKDLRTDAGLVIKGITDTRLAADNTRVAQDVTIWGLGDSLTWGTASFPTAEFPGGTPWLELFKRQSGFNYVQAGVPGETSTQIKTRALADTDNYTKPTVIWAGTNNAGGGPNPIVSDIKAIVNKLGHQNYLVLGLLGQGNSDFWAGTSNYNNIKNINDSLRVNFVGHFVDTRARMVASYNPEIAQDVIDHSHDLWPTRLTVDGTHLYTEGYQIIADGVHAQDSVLYVKPANGRYLLTSTLKGMFGSPPPIGFDRPSGGAFNMLNVNGQPSQIMYDALAQTNWSKFNMRGSSVFYHSSPSSGANAGIAIKENTNGSLGYANMEISGTSPYWTASKGLIFSNGGNNVTLGSDLNITGGLQVSATGVLGAGVVNGRLDVSGAISNIGRFNTAERALHLVNPGGSLNGGIIIPTLDNTSLPSYFVARPGEMLYNTDTKRLQFASPYTPITNAYTFKDVATLDDITAIPYRVAPGAGISLSGTGVAGDEIIITNTTLPATGKFTGTPFESGPPYGGAGFGADKAFDDNITTAYGGAANTDLANGYVGLNLTSAGVLTKIRIRPYDGQTLLGTKIQGSNTSISAGFVDLLTLPEVPFYQWSQYSIASTTPYKYFRLYNASGVYQLAVFELEFYGYVPAPVINLTTIGTSGAATFVGTTLNIPNYTTDTTSLSSRINLKAPLASPTFTGTVTIPTASTGDSSNTAASTAWVKRQLYGSGGGGGAGTVTSVGLSLPSIFSVSGSPVTTTGTLTGTLATQSANTFFSGATSGGAATPTFRTLVSADIPSSVALAGAPTTTTASVLDSSGKIATTAYVDRATAKGAVTYTTLGGGTSPLASIVTVADTSKINYNSLVYNTGAAATLTSNAILVGNVHTNAANLFSNAGTQTISRTSDGAALTILGPSAGGNSITIGTNAANNFINEFVSNKRLDFNAGSNPMYFTANQINLQGNSIVGRTGESTTIGTSKKSYDLFLQSAQYIGSSNTYRGGGLRYNPSTSVASLAWLEMYVGSGASGNSDHGDGLRFMRIGTDSSWIVDAFKTTVNAGVDSALSINNGTIKKSAFIGGRTGIPTLGTLTGGGTGATTSLTDGGMLSNDAAGTITITTGTGTIGTLSVTLSFNVQYLGYIPKVMITPANAAATGIQAYPNATNAAFTLGTVGTASASTVYKFNYLIVQ